MEKQLKMKLGERQLLDKFPVGFCPIINKYDKEYVKPFIGKGSCRSLALLPLKTGETIVEISLYKSGMKECPEIMYNINIE